jgi:hypothetical protein
MFPDNTISMVYKHYHEHGLVIINITLLLPLGHQNPSPEGYSGGDVDIPSIYTPNVPTTTHLQGSITQTCANNLTVTHFSFLELFITYMII